MKGKIILLYLFFLYILFCQSDRENIKKSNPPDEQAYLGILYIESSYGIQIAEVFPDSPAEKANLERGDIILSANGYPIVGTYTLKERIFSLKPGTKVKLEIEKINGSKTYVEAILEPIPEKYKNIYKGNSY